MSTTIEEFDDRLVANLTDAEVEYLREKHGTTGDEVVIDGPDRVKLAAVHGLEIPLELFDVEERATEPSIGPVLEDDGDLVDDDFGIRDFEKLVAGLDAPDDGELESLKELLLTLAIAAIQVESASSEVSDYLLNVYNAAGRSDIVDAARAALELEPEESIPETEPAP
jgi:hypothetical protein